MEQERKKFILDIEKQVCTLREKALEIVHKINPTIPYIIDNYYKGDYWVGSIDPNSRWYPCYKFPSSDNEETFIENLVSDTLEHFKNYKTIVINVSLWKKDKKSNTKLNQLSNIY